MNFGFIGDFINSLFGGGNNQKKQQTQRQQQPQQQSAPAPAIHIQQQNQDPVGIQQPQPFSLNPQQQKQQQQNQPPQLGGVTLHIVPHPASAPQPAPQAPHNPISDAIGNAASAVGHVAQGAAGMVHDFTTDPNNVPRNVLDYVTGIHNGIDGATYDYQHKDAHGNPTLVPAAAPTNFNDQANNTLGGTLINDLLVKPTVQAAPRLYNTLTSNSASTLPKFIQDANAGLGYKNSDLESSFKPDANGNVDTLGGTLNTIGDAASLIPGIGIAAKAGVKGGSKLLGAVGDALRGIAPAADSAAADTRAAGAITKGTPVIPDKPAITSPNRPNPIAVPPTPAVPSVTPPELAPGVSLRTPTAAEPKPATVPIDTTPAPAESPTAKPSILDTAEPALAEKPPITTTTDDIPDTENTGAQIDDTQSLEKQPGAVDKTNPLQRTFLSKVNLIRATKTDAGNALADKIVAAEDRHVGLTGSYMDQLKTTMSLRKGDFEKAWRVQEGEIDPATVSPKVAKAAAELKAVMPQIKAAAEKAGVINGDLGDSYMPHYHAHEDPTTSMPGESTSKARQFGNLEKERTSNDPNYLRTKDVLQGYIDHASKRIAQAEQFGKDNEVAKDLIGKIGAQGGDGAIANKAFSRYYTPPKSDSALAGVSKGARVFQSALQLPLSFISHAGQTSNVAADTGLFNTLKAAGKVILRNPKTMDHLSKSGVITPQSLGHYSKEYTSFGGKIANKVTAPLLKPVMKFNRSVAETAYEQKAAKLAAKGDTEGLQKLGVQGDTSGGKLSDEQLLQAGRGGTKRTMFMNSAADTPIGAETPFGKAAWQYRGAYARPQTGFIYNHVLKPVAHGKVAPLARYGTIGTSAAVGTTMAKNAITGKPNDPASVASSVVPTMTGMPGEIASSLITGAKSGGKGFLESAAGQVAPILGEVAKLGGAIGDSVQGKSVTPLERYGLKKVPIIGGRLAASLTPTQAQQSAALNPSAPSAPSSGNPIADFANGVGSTINGIFHPTPPDATTTEMQRLTSENGVKFTTAENSALNSKGIKPLANSLINDPIYQNADDQTRLSMMKSVLHGTATKGISDKLGAADKQALLDYKLQSTADKKAWLDDNHNATSYYTALYNNAVKSGSINEKIDNDLANKNSLKYKMVAAQVDEKYNNGEGADPDLKANYASTSASRIAEMLNPKSVYYDEDTANALLAYDKARVDAGLRPKYNTSVIGKTLSAAAAKGTKLTAAQKAFTFANLPAGMSGTGTGTGSGGSKYAKEAPLFTPIASLQSPAGAVIPKGRSISVAKVQQT